MLLALFGNSVGTNSKYPGKVLDVIYVAGEARYNICRFDGGTFVNDDGTEGFHHPTTPSIHGLSLQELYMVDQELLVLECRKYLINHEVCFL